MSHCPDGTARQPRAASWSGFTSTRGNDEKLSGSPPFDTNASPGSLSDERGAPVHKSRSAPVSLVTTSRPARSLGASP